MYTVDLYVCLCGGEKVTELLRAATVPVRPCVWVRVALPWYVDSSAQESWKQKDLGSIPLRLSYLFKMVVVCGHCLVTLSLTINEILKWLSSLPILMQESFRW